MSSILGNPRTQELYALQESVILGLQSMVDPQFSQAKLCGGTALSRFWLSHRISYDLDFFLAQGFDARNLSVSMKKFGIDYEIKDIVDDPRKANQLHGYVLVNGARLKVSFIEDAYFDLFPAIDKTLGNLFIRTECVEALYHRKLRTVSGHASEGDSFDGGRQKARDVFDLYVLSQSVMPLQPFMKSLPYAFPSAAFNNGLVSMPWFDLVDELSEIVCDDKWIDAKDVAVLQARLYEQIGAVLIPDDVDVIPAPSPTPKRNRCPR